MMEKPVNLRAEELLEESGRLFNKYGYKKTTLDDIARAVGITKSTMYHYYKSKEDIFRAVTRQWFLEDVEEFEEILAKPGDFRTLITQAVENMISVKDNRRSIEQSSWNDQAEVVSVIQDLIQEFMFRIENVFYHRFEQAIEDGELLRHDYKLTANIIFMTMHGATNIEEFYGIKPFIAGKIPEVVEFVLRPYLVIKGKKNGQGKN